MGFENIGKCPGVLREHAVWEGQIFVGCGNRDSAGSGRNELSSTSQPALSDDNSPFDSESHNITLIKLTRTRFDRPKSLSHASPWHSRSTVGEVKGDG
ncbi:hypothetical protein Cob_v000218 [Colletotrichum orbiculare MAFF 240422]|uniref:Uncharacterized protein n=1 Tax=Colletotrichum orbiculare (strain 104-T / ATCC 96160 / CBS 514.97 / LARS 414 / MAFF 240422) TaxID=1213857 RepID=A0A484G9G4_COLOR|nr:hypothetical protein Cob_v000218 [Colletotrichum orbiculare MAFF 240422]